MIGIEIFSGAGGMSVGAEMAGIDIKLGIDIDPYACETFKYNHPKALVINKDIREVKNINISKTDSTVLFGGPPCQGYSKSNTRTRNIDNEKNWFYKDYIRLLIDWKPDWFVFENVAGLKGAAKGFFFNEILKDFTETDYNITWDILNAKDFGVPQNRERLFIVGSLKNNDFKFPHPNGNIVTVGDALKDLPKLENGSRIKRKAYQINKCSEYAKILRRGSIDSRDNYVSRNTDLVVERYKYIPEGGNWKDIPDHLMTDTYKDHSRCHTGIYHRLDSKLPAVVIGNYRKNMLIHPWENRGLSVREAARLQSFPDTFEFKGFLGNQQQQVGNAVPPLLAKAIFDKILSSN